MKKTGVISNFIWRFAERCGAQLVTGIVSLLLARILAPADYGRIALVEVFMNILYVFVDCGLCTALIQKKKRMSWIFHLYFILTLRHVLCCMRSYFWRHRTLQLFIRMQS